MANQIENSLVRNIKDAVDKALNMEAAIYQGRNILQFMTILFEMLRIPIMFY